MHLFILNRFIDKFMFGTYPTILYMLIFRDQDMIPLPLGGTTTHSPLISTNITNPEQSS